jgi:hypothetical protein
MSRRSKAGYFELKGNDEENDPRSSINSSSPILPIEELDEFDEQTSLKPAAFDTDGLETFYRPTEGYEGAHRYDPEYRWSAADEGKVVRKVFHPLKLFTVQTNLTLGQIDFWICSWVCLMFFALQLDRGNIVQALSDNMLGDLGLNTNDYNYGQAIFYFSFLMAELPSQLISKWVGPDRWIPIQMVSWSIIASSQAFLSGRTSFYVCRALLGMIEGTPRPSYHSHLCVRLTSNTKAASFPTTFFILAISTLALNSPSACPGFGSLLKLQTSSPRSSRMAYFIFAVSTAWRDGGGSSLWKEA